MGSFGKEQRRDEIRWLEASIAALHAEYEGEAFDDDARQAWEQWNARLDAVLADERELEARRARLRELGLRRTTGS